MGSLPLFCLRVPIPTAMGKTGTTYLRLPQTTESPPPQRVGNKAPLTPTLMSFPLVWGNFGLWF